MTDALEVFTADAPKASESTSRRTVLKGVAWAMPVVAVSVATPLAAATTRSNSDIILSFGDTVEGSTRDITFAVVDFVDQTIRSLGPQEPTPPELILPPEPTRPPGFPNPFNPAWQAYATALAAWAAEVAELNAGHAAAVAAYLQELATYQAWNLAVAAFIDRLRQVAIDSEGLFFASVTYPRTLNVLNAGPEALAAGTLVTVEVSSDINLINGYFPQVGPVQIIQTGGTTFLNYTVPVAVPAGGLVFSQDLVYNPAAVTLNITGSVTQSSITGTLSPMSQDTDVNNNGDIVTSPVGIRLDVATGDVQAILAEWQQFLQTAIDFYDLVSPILPPLDWGDIISGILPLPTP